MKLKQFIDLTNTKLEAEIGISTFDLPDLDWYIYFDEELSDTELADMADEVVSDIKYDNNLA
jgi:hypothetical protein